MTIVPKPTKKAMVVAGAALAGATALGVGVVTSISPAHALTVTHISGTGSTQGDAYLDAVGRCTAGGGDVKPSGVTFTQNEDGTWTVLINCTYNT